MPCQDLVVWSFFLLPIFNQMIFYFTSQNSNPYLNVLVRYRGLALCDKSNECQSLTYVFCYFGLGSTMDSSLHTRRQHSEMSAISSFLFLKWAWNLPSLAFMLLFCREHIWRSTRENKLLSQSDIPEIMVCLLSKLDSIYLSSLISKIKMMVEPTPLSCWEEYPR